MTRNILLPNAILSFDKVSYEVDMAFEEARAEACVHILDAISSKQLIWLDKRDDSNIIKVCGREELYKARNLVR